MGRNCQRALRQKADARLSPGDQDRAQPGDGQPERGGMRQAGELPSPSVCLLAFSIFFYFNVPGSEHRRQQRYQAATSQL
jgi:hypothetical protein